MTEALQRTDKIKNTG